MNRCINGCYAPRRRPRLVCVACSLGMPPERNPDTSAIAAGICAFVTWAVDQRAGAGDEIMTLAKAIAAARKKTTEVCAPWKIRLAFWHPAVYVEVSPASYGSYSAYMRVDPGVLTVDAKHSLYIPGEYQMGVAVAISTEWEVYE